MENEVSVAGKASWMRPDLRSQLKMAGSWRWSALLLACSAAVLVSFRHTLFLMVDTWYRSRTYSHCFLILPLFLYLVWVRRERLAGLYPVPNYWGLPLLGGLAFIWVLGNLGEVRVVQELAVISILIAVVWTILGTVLVRTLAFPLLFLFFAVPFGISLIRPLQNFTTWFVIHALTISNVPAVLENHTISLPSGVWTIAEACSGIRFLLSSVVLGTVFSFLMYQSRKRRLIFMCASVVVPIIGNGLRAYGIIMLAYLTNNKVAAGVDHIVYGGVFAVFIQLVLVAVGLRWRQKPDPIKGIAPDHPGVLTSEMSDNGLRGKAAVFLAATVFALIVLAPVAATRLWNRATAATEWVDPPVKVTAPWQVAANDDRIWPSDVHGADKRYAQSFKHESSRVDLDWILYSGRQRPDLAAISKSTGDERPSMSDDFGSAIVNDQRIEVHRSWIESERRSRVVWTWYSVSGEYTANAARVRLLQAKARLLGMPAEVAVIGLGADSESNISEAERTLQEFLRHASFLNPDPKRLAAK